MPQVSLAHGIHKDPISDSYNSEIISNIDFRAKDTMSEAQIQQFLVDKGSALATYTIPTDGSVPTMIGPNDTIDGRGWTAARVIYESAQWYSINPQALFATLQKESSLVLSGTLSYLSAAMGYDCPESNACDPADRGFARQVDGAAFQLDYNFRYSELNDANRVGVYRVGNTITLDGKSTYLGNSATAALYRYTPHRPDSGYLTATNGSHYYGNYNFIYYCKLWFNITNGKVPVYRFYNMKNSTHFYTANEAEKINVMNKYSSTYRYEAVVYVLDNTKGKNTVPLYRFYNMKNGSHFYTANEEEKNSVIARWPGTFKFEGIVYYVAPNAEGASPVYRFWNVKGTHFYTSNEEEKNNVLQRWPNIFKYEAIGYYIGT